MLPKRLFYSFNNFFYLLRNVNAIVLLNCHINQSLLFARKSMLIVVYTTLLADTKMLKDILQYHVICYFSGYVVEVEDALTDVLRKEVT